MPRDPGAPAPPARAPSPPPQPSSAGKGAVATLLAAVGAAMAAILLNDTRTDEGVRYDAYRDLGGVWSICSGTAHGVKPGEVDTAEQCDARTAADLLSAYRGVIACVPGLKAPERHEQLRAVIRFQNNTGKFCASPAARLMKAGQWRAGCDALTAYDGIVAAKPIPGAVRVRRLKDGRYFSEIRGLINRRAHEHAVCVEGLKP